MRTSTVTLSSITVTSLSVALSRELSPRSAIWQPQPGTTWQVILTGVVDVSKQPLVPDIDVWDIDLFKIPASTIQSIKQGGAKVVCYLSAGSYEPDRPDDDKFTNADLGNTSEGWPDENWLKLQNQNVKWIMGNRTLLAKQKGCDGLDPDNMDGYMSSTFAKFLRSTEDNGSSFTKQISINFFKNLADVAAKNGLAIGLKNALEIIADVQPSIQFALNEQCHEYSECDNYASPTQQRKAVFNNEYPGQDSVTRDQACKSVNGVTLSTILKPANLEVTGEVGFCDARKDVTTPTK